MNAHYLNVADRYANDHGVYTLDEFRAMCVECHGAAPELVDHGDGDLSDDEGIVLQRLHGTVARPARRVEDEDDCLSAAAEWAISTGADVSVASMNARWDSNQRDYILIDVDPEAEATILRDSPAGFERWTG